MFKRLLFVLGRVVLLMGFYPNKLSSWWLNQHIWKICSSKWVHLPQIPGWKFKKIFELPPASNECKPQKMGALVRNDFPFQLDDFWGSFSPFIFIQPRLCCCNLVPSSPAPFRSKKLLKSVATSKGFLRNSWMDRSCGWDIEAPKKYGRIPHSNWTCEKK